MKHLCKLLLLIFITSSAFGQFKKLSDLGKGLGKGLKKPVSRLVEGNPPISTSFQDVNLEGTLEPTWGDAATYKPLISQPKNGNGEFVLEPGYYETRNLSYCLKMGTPPPSSMKGAKGSAVYGLGPLEGKMDDIVLAILQKSHQLWLGSNADSAGKKSLLNTVANTGIAQKDVQVLLWAIIAGAEFTNLSARMKVVTSALLTPQQILKLNGGAVKTLTNFATDKGFLELPPIVQQIERARQEFRSMFNSGNYTFEQLEQIALPVLGVEENDPIPAGTWFKHPKGYYVRYKPEGYQRTVIQVYVPEGIRADFSATGTVATPTDSKQRLAQTDVPVEVYEKLSL
jgi:hypothetical protein